MCEMFGCVDLCLIERKVVCCSHIEALCSQREQDAGQFLQNLFVFVAFWDIEQQSSPV